MRRMTVMAKEFVYNRNQRVVEQNRQVENIYIVLKGEFAINRKSVNIQQLVNNMENEVGFKKSNVND